MKKILIALALLFALSPFFVGRIKAGGYGYGFHQNYGYGYNGYHQNYYQAVNPVVVIGVPVSNLGVPYYWSVGDELREDRIAQKVSEKLKGGQAPAKTSQSNTRPAREVVAPGPGPGILLDFDLVSGAVDRPYLPGEPSSKPGQITELDQKVAGIFAKNCARCHKPGTDKPALRLLNADGSLYKPSDFKADLKHRQLVYDAVRGTDGVSSMPKNGEQLPDEELETLYLWLREQSQ